MPTNADDLPAYAPMDDPVFPEEDTPRTFMQIRQQIDQLGQDLENNLISVREYDERRTNLDIVCGQLVSGNEALLDAAAGMLQTLELIVEEKDALFLMGVIIHKGVMTDAEEYIKALIAKAKGEI